MAIVIAVLREQSAGERRVAVVPSIVAKLTQLGAEVSVQSRAGEAAMFPDASYQHVTFACTAEALVAGADIVLAVQPPSVDVVKAMKPGALLLSLIYGQGNADLVAALRDARITTLAMELIPRISRAQSMDVLSSQAALAGYYAPLLGAVHMPRILPMMTTAVGSLTRPIHVGR